MDEQIILWIQENLRNPMLTDIFTFFTMLGRRMGIWFVIAFLLLISKRTRKIGIACCLALILSYAVNNLMIKNIVQRARPYDVIDHLKVLISRPESYSFPSGHAASSFAAAGSIFRNSSKKIYGVLALTLATIIAFSRVYLGVHYMSDIVVGAVSGLVMSVIAQRIINVSYRLYS